MELEPIVSVPGRGEAHEPTDKILQMADSLEDFELFTFIQQYTQCDKDEAIKLMFRARCEQVEAMITGAMSVEEKRQLFGAPGFLGKGRDVVQLIREDRDQFEMMLEEIFPLEQAANIIRRLP